MVRSKIWFGLRLRRPQEDSFRCEGCRIFAFCLLPCYCVCDCLAFFFFSLYIVWQPDLSECVILCPLGGCRMHVSRYE